MYNVGREAIKSIKQLLEAKEDLEAWFATEGVHGWRYIPMIYSEKIDIKIDCINCRQFIIEGKNYLQHLHTVQWPEERLNQISNPTN